jgi:hypothetical protein
MYEFHLYANEISNCDFGRLWFVLAPSHRVVMATKWWDTLSEIDHVSLA